MKISVIIPVFNEQKFILNTLKNVQLQKQKFDLEIIVIDDKSTDGTLEILANNSGLYDKLVKSSSNLGKGNALKLGFENSTGEIILIQDADQEYDPNQYDKLIEPFEKFDADFVLGSRFRSEGYRRVIYYSHELANKFLTFICNILLNKNFTDIETGYKVFKKNLISNLQFTRNDFGIEIELVMKLSKVSKKIYEIGINYNGRSYAEGKKIALKDGLIALYLLIYFTFKK